MNTLNDILDKVKKSGLMIVLGVFSFYFAINEDSFAHLKQILFLDYLEERARIVLNMVGDGEYVILDKDIDKQ